MSWGQSWGSSWGNSWGDSSVAVIPDAGPIPSGGFPWEPFENLPGNRFLKRRVRRVIEEVALQQVQDLHLDEQQRFEQLTRELELKNIEFEASYLEALNDYRGMLINLEIRKLLNQKDENEAMLLILIAAHI